jgi:hypothetical protein
MMPALHRFAHNPTEQNYAQATLAYMSECQMWQVWKRHCAEVIGAGSLSFEQIAYSNCLPWRTASKSRFSDDVARKTAELYVRPLIDDLNPGLIMAMGKRVKLILEMTGLSLPRIIVWNRSQAATVSARRDRGNAAREIVILAGLGSAGQPIDKHFACDEPRPSKTKKSGIIQTTGFIASDVIRLQISGNPKNGKSRLRFACYRDGMTVADYTNEVGQRCGAAEAPKCTPDLKWDSDRHFIRIERNGK